MTVPGGGARCGEAASAAVGYTYPPRSLLRQASTETGPGIASGARRSAAPASPSISTASPDLVTVAALYVETDGAYYGVAGVDPWDEARDARLYAGPHPVVAHPPCRRWSIMGACRGLRDGNDDGCFAAALAAVRRFGGVLEHPRYSLAWDRFGLPRPGAFGWVASLTDPGIACEVDQRHYGHRTRKPTWLYYVGASEPPPIIFWPGPPSHVTAHNSHHGPGGHRAYTPPDFRDLLLSIARAA